MSRERKLKERYNMSLEQYEDLLRAQDGKCKICKILAIYQRVKLVVDHCHTTGKVRGLLCNACNRMLGYGRDNPDILRRGIEYLYENNQ
jgi:hypothetical protein